jgi:hypothetical protein
VCFGLPRSFEKHRLKITEKKRREEVEKVHKTLGGADDEPAPEDYETPLASFRESTPSILTPEEQIALSKAELNQVIAAEQSWQPLDNYKLKSMWMFGSDHPVSFLPLLLLMRWPTFVSSDILRYTGEGGGVRTMHQRVVRAAGAGFDLRQWSHHDAGEARHHRRS